MNKIWLVAGGLLIGCLACSKQLTTSFRGFVKPQGWPEPSYAFSNNSVSREGFELGRKLFYEPLLSRDNSISCGSCHLQAAAFTHHGHDLSHGIDDRLGSRNAPPIMNLAWSSHFFWDGGIFDLDLQPLAPISNPVEMDESMPRVLEKLAATDRYPVLFERAFGSREITGARMFKALSQFMLLCISSNSRYDSVQRKQAQFTAEEQKGYLLFRTYCSSCHQEPLFTDNSFRNNGIGSGANADPGRYQITLRENDRFRFKVPSLRNIAATAPYMHDGRFYTLQAVLDHYGSTIPDSPTLDTAMRVSGKPGFPLTASDKQHLLTFLNTLTDRSFLSDKLLSE